MFEPYGRVEDVRVLRADSQGAADVGLVDMSCTREATNAKKMLDGVVFYRVVKAADNFGFVQFGGLGDPKRMLPPIAHEPTTQTGLSHTDGVLSVARFEPGSARGEFTIMLGAQTGLDANPSAPGDNLGYAAFAKVVKGREVLTRILDTPIDPAKTVGGVFAGEMPGSPVRIISARRVTAP